MSKLALPLLKQWTDVYTKRAFKTGVSEKLRTFDEVFPRKLEGKKYVESELLRMNHFFAEDAHQLVDMLGKSLTTIKTTGPKVGKWTSKELAFLEDLIGDLKTAKSFFAKQMK